jgi:hypothetical protein
MTAQTPDYKCMLAQGICMCLWYSTPHTLMALDKMNCTENFFGLVFSLTETTVKQDFEIKRFVIGLSSVVQRDPNELPPQVQQQMGNIMKVIVFLCQKSIVVRVKNQEKAEQCEEDNIEGKGEIYEDEENPIELISDDEDDEEDEDYDCNEDVDRDLYDSKLDTLDEVLFCRDIFQAMEQQNPQVYQFYFLQCLDQNDQGAFQQAVQKAIEYQQYIQQQQQ